MDYEATPRTKTSKKANKKTKPKESIDMNKQTYKETVANHRAEIKKQKQSIAAHKLLMKQARIQYKLTKVTKG